MSFPVTGPGGRRRQLPTYMPWAVCSSSPNSTRRAAHWASRSNSGSGSCRVAVMSWDSAPVPVSVPSSPVRRAAPVRLSASSAGSGPPVAGGLPAARIARPRAL